MFKINPLKAVLFLALLAVIESAEHDELQRSANVALGNRVDGKIFF